MKKAFYFALLAGGPLFGVVRIFALLYGIDPSDGFALSPAFTVLFIVCCVLAAAAAVLAAQRAPDTAPAGVTPVTAILYFVTAALACVVTVFAFLAPGSVPTLPSVSYYPTLLGFLGFLLVFALLGLILTGLGRRPAAASTTGLLMLGPIVWCGVNAVFRFIYYITLPVRQETVLLIAMYVLPFLGVLYLGKYRAGFGGGPAAVFWPMLAYVAVCSEVIPQLFARFSSAAVFAEPLDWMALCYLALALLLAAEAGRSVLTKPRPAAPDAPAADRAAPEA